VLKLQLSMPFTAFYTKENQPKRCLRNWLRSWI